MSLTRRPASRASARPGPPAGLPGAGPAWGLAAWHQFAALGPAVANRQPSGRSVRRHLAQSWCPVHSPARASAVPSARPARRQARSIAGRPDRVCWPVAPPGWPERRGPPVSTCPARLEWRCQKPVGPGVGRRPWPLAGCPASGSGRATGLGPAPESGASPPRRWWWPFSLSCWVAGARQSECRLVFAARSIGRPAW